MNNKYISFLVSIDYRQEERKDLSSFDSEQTFTIIDWLIADQIAKSRGLSFKDLTPQEQKRLTFNIFHKGDTLLKLLCSENKELDQENAVKETKAIFEAQKQADDDDDVSYEVPIIPDLTGETALEKTSQLHEAVIYDAIKDYRLYSVNRFMVQPIMKAFRKGKQYFSDSPAMP